MPFLNTGVLGYLFDLAPDFDVVVPKIGKKIEPLHAMYSKKCIPHIKSLLDTGKLQILQLFDQVHTRYVARHEIIKYDPLCMSFFNINTEHNLHVAKILGEQ
jgi:molybdopterin-guanine dinucleotide biosynthesis protein A